MTRYVSPRIAGIGTLSFISPMLRRVSSNQFSPTGMIRNTRHLRQFCESGVNAYSAVEMVADAQAF